MALRLIVLAALGLLAACKGAQPAADPAANNAAADANAAAARANAAAPVDPLGAAPATKEAALHLMHERHEGMEDIGKAFKLIGGEMKSDAPDLAKVRPAAARIAELAAKSPGWFPPGTGPDVGKTRALPAIWEKPQDFAAKDREFLKAAQEFNAALQGQDLAAIRAAHATLGKTCKGCHDDYRSEKKIAHD